jgi:hypothetical protein
LFVALSSSSYQYHLIKFILLAHIQRFMMILQLESLPNELFLHGIFPYLSLIDLNYAFVMLNQRFNRLVSSFLTEMVHNIHLTRDITWHEMTFIIDYVLPYLDNNHQLKSLESCHADIFLKFLNNVDQINTHHLKKIVVTPFIDIHFDQIIKFLSECSQLNEIKLNVMTNLDKSWANGRKWTRWFEIMIKNNRQNTLKTLEICVWCINTNDAINFDSRIWNRDGIYRDNLTWKVQLKPDQGLNWRQSRQSVEFSRSDQDYLTLVYKKQNSSCVLS